MSKGIGELLAMKAMADMISEGGKRERPQFKLSLQELVESYQAREDIRPGDVVVWKDGMQNKRTPEYGEEAWVVEVLEDPVFDSTAETSSPYYRERLDMKLAVKDKDGELMMFLYDGNRFRLKHRYPRD